MTARARRCPVPAAGRATIAKAAVEAEPVPIEVVAPRSAGDAHGVRVARERARAAELHLASGMEELGRRAAGWRLVAYRDYVGRMIRTVSPLLLRRCAAAEVSLEQLAWRLAPDMPWTPWLCGPGPWSPGAPTRAGTVNLAKPTPEEVAAYDLTRFAESGLVVEDVGERDGWGLRVLGSGLETAFFMSEARVRTFGHRGALSLPGELPATVAAALPGRRLDEFVANPLLDGAGFVVTSVDEADRWGTKVRFVCPPVAWRMPWARGAAGEGGRSADDEASLRRGRTSS